MKTFKENWEAYIPGVVLLAMIAVICFTGCHSNNDPFLSPPKEFVKIPNRDNLYYVPTENNIVVYINYSWSSEQGYGIMEFWRNGYNDEIYHYDANTNTMYTLED